MFRTINRMHRNGLLAAQVFASVDLMVCDRELYMFKMEPVLHSKDTSPRNFVKPITAFLCRLTITYLPGRVLK